MARCTYALRAALHFKGGRGGASIYLQQQRSDKKRSWYCISLQDLWPGDTAAGQAINHGVGIPCGAHNYMYVV